MSFPVRLILELVRRRLDDFGGDRDPEPDGTPAWVADDLPCLWKNEELKGYLRETILEIGARNPIQDDRATIALIPGIRFYRLPNSVLIVRSASRESDEQTLLKANRVEIDHLDRAYRMQTGYLNDWLTDGSPSREAERVTHFILDERAQHLAVYPTPTERDRIRLSVLRTYKFDDCQPGHLPDEIGTGAMMQDALVSGTCARAFKCRDADGGDANKSKEFEAEFFKIVGPPQTLHGLNAKLKWGERQPRITPKVNYF